MTTQLVTVWNDSHSWAIGFLVVAVTAYGRFNSPPTNRSSTTWARYHVLATAYTLATVVAWIALANTPDLLRTLGPQVALLNQLPGLDAPMYAAVLISVLVGLPPCSIVDLKARTFLQNLARIPWEAQRLSAALRARTWLPDRGFQSDILSDLRTAGFRDTDLSFSSARTPQALWTRVTALRHYVQQWESRHGKFAGFYFANLATIRALEDDHARIGAMARRVFPILPKASGDGDPVREEVARGFMAAAERLERDLCDLVSRGVLTCGLTGRARRMEFETLGFFVDPTPSKLFDNLVGLYVALSGIYVTLMLAVGRPHPVMSGLVIATIYAGAVVIALICERSNLWAELPTARYTITAVLAFWFGSISSLALATLLTFDVVTAAQLFFQRWWPWGLMSATVAGALAYLVDERERSPLPRWAETLVVGAGCGLMGVPVVWLLHRHCAVPCDAAPLARVLPIGLLVGSVIGFFVPTWNRRPQRSVTTYQKYRIAVEVRRGADESTASVVMTRPRSDAAADGPVPTFPDHEGISPEEALAEAIGAARLWIDRDLAGRQPRPFGVANVPAVA